MDYSGNGITIINTGVCRKKIVSEMTNNTTPQSSSLGSHKVQ